MSDSVRLKFKANAAVSEADIRELLRLPGVCSAPSGGFSSRMPDDEVSFDHVTGRDITRAVDNRWEIKLDVSLEVLGTFRSQAEPLGQVKCHNSEWLGLAAGQHIPS